MEQGFLESAMSERHSPPSDETPIKVLLTDTNRWGLSARLAMSLSEAGCQVFGLCPPGRHPLKSVSTVLRTFRYSGTHPLQSLTAAIGACDPSIVIPVSDRGVGHLHELFTRATASGPAGAKIATLIEHSLGPASSFSIVSSRYDLLEIAREEGIFVPKTKRVNRIQDLDPWIEKQTFPWVLKVDGTSGGGGVKVVRSIREARQRFAQLSEMFSLRKAIKRLVVNRDSFWFLPWWKREKTEISMQSHIDGRPANCAAVCWQGRVLALIGAEVVRSAGTTGPASVVRIVEDEQMREAAQKIALRLSLSGFFGLDFMIEHGTDISYLVEMNPRPAPPCHLRLGEGQDLAGALWSQLAQGPMVTPARRTKSDVVVYFPDGLKTKEEMPIGWFLDIPEGEKELANELRNPFPDRTFLFRLVQWFAGTRSDGAEETAEYPIPDRLERQAQPFPAETAILTADRPEPAVEKAQVQSA